MATARRAIGIIRVSQVAGREGDRFVSPSEQRQKIETLCGREGLRLLDTTEELDVSGGAPLEKRKGLLRAVETIEAGRADVIVCGYFDRLVRSIKVQAEVVERVEAADGEVLLADFGKLTNGTAVQRLTGQMIGAVNEYVRVSTAERLAATQQIAIDQGRWPVILIPGLRRDEDGQVELDPDTCEIVAEAVRMRAGGATVEAIRDHLKAHGIDRSHHGTGSLLRSRQAIGEIKFGGQVGTIPAIIDRATWDRAQRRVIPRGPKPKSERLLARLGVLRCGSCDSRMVVATGGHSSYFTYRCPPQTDCPHHMNIGAEIVETAVIEYVKNALRGLTGVASGAVRAQEALITLERSQAALDGAVAALDGLTAEPSVREKLLGLRDARDSATAAYEDAVDDDRSMTLAITAGGNWDELSPEGRRDLVKALIDRVVIRPGRGAERIEIEPR